MCSQDEQGRWVPVAPGLVAMSPMQVADVTGLNDESLIVEQALVSLGGDRPIFVDSGASYSTEPDESKFTVLHKRSDLPSFAGVGPTAQQVGGEGQVCRVLQVGGRTVVLPHYARWAPGGKYSLLSTEDLAELGVSTHIDSHQGMPSTMTLIPPPELEWGGLVNRVPQTASLVCLASVNIRINCGRSRRTRRILRECLLRSRHSVRSRVFQQ